MRRDRSSRAVDSALTCLIPRGKVPGLHDRRQRCQAWISRQAFDGGSGSFPADAQQFWLALLDAVRQAAALADAGYHPGRRPTNQMRRRWLH
jgi:hypothetical protein